MTEKSKSATEFFVRTGIPAREWNSYRENNFDVTGINKDTAANSKLIKQFSQLASLVLLSSNSKLNIEKVLKYIGIPSNLFLDIVCSDNQLGEGSFRKIDELTNIRKKYNLEYVNMLSIGDRYKTDVEPILELGGMGVVVDGAKELWNVLEALKSGDWSNISFYEVRS